MKHRHVLLQGCENCAVAEFKGIIQQILDNKDLEIVYAIFGGGNGSK